MLRLGRAGDIIERHPRVLLDVDLGPALADAREPARAHSHSVGEAAIEEEPDAEEGEGGNDPRQEVREQIRFLAAAHVDARIAHLPSERLIDAHARGHELRLSVLRSLECADDVAVGDRHFRDRLLRNLTLELAVRDLLRRRRLMQKLLHQHDSDDGDRHVPEV